MPYNTDIRGGAAVCYLGSYFTPSIPFYLKIVNRRVKTFVRAEKQQALPAGEGLRAGKSLTLVRV